MNTIHIARDILPSNQCKFDGGDYSNKILRNWFISVYFEHRFMENVYLRNQEGFYNCKADFFLNFNLSMNCIGRFPFSEKAEYWKDQTNNEGIWPNTL